MANYLIIGASSGIGQAISSALESEGNQTFKTAKDNSKITPDITLDATNFEAVEESFQMAVSKLGSLDGVVCCAGSLWLKPAHMTDFDTYQNVIHASLTTAFATVRSAGKFMKNGGSVVLFSSAAACHGIPNHEAIAAAKAGVMGLVRSAAATYATQQLRFNAVAPGLVDSPLTSALTAPGVRQFSEAMNPLGRIGSPGDIARVVTFLLDPQNSWITGQVWAVDGGLSTIRPKMKA
jgi:NAD(P)-dependent dehydrogenase (short-subunit alcohol dehydrogenase family)